MGGRRTSQEPPPYDGVPTVDVKIKAEPEARPEPLDEELTVVDVPVTDDTAASGDAPSED